MKSNFLLPHRCKPVGWVLLIISVILLIIFALCDEVVLLECTVFAVHASPMPGGHDAFLSFIKDDYFGEIASILFIISGIMVAFSKVRNEDEYITKIRLESLLWAVYINYFFLILSLLFLFELSFMLALVFNIFTLLIIFIIRFNYIIFKNKRALSNEK